MKKDFELIPHTADLALRVYGAALEELFCNALIGMFQSIGPQSPDCELENGRTVCSALPQDRNIVLTAPDNELLLVDFLSQAVSLSDIYDEAYLGVTMHELNETDINATVHGVRVTGFALVEIKAVTHHGLHIKKVGDSWQVDIVFDI